MALIPREDDDPITMAAALDGLRKAIETMDLGKADKYMAIDMSLVARLDARMSEVRDGLHELSESVRDVVHAIRNLPEGLVGVQEPPAVARESTPEILHDTKIITLNHNDIVKVRLNPDGVKAYRKYYDGAEPMIDEDGWTGFQLWDLVNIMGAAWRYSAPFEMGNLKIDLNQLAPGQLRGEHP